MKKTLTMILSLALVAALSIAGTLAYLTSTTQQVENTFSVGKVSIDLDEGKFDKATGTHNPSERVKANDYGTLVPGVEYDKDPIVTVKKDSEDCYVFVKVQNGLGTYESDAVGYTNIDAQIKANGWTAYTTGGATGVYYKDAPKSDVDQKLNVFGNFMIDGDGVTAETVINPIIIKAAAVQKDGIADLDTAYAQISAELNKLD